MKNNLKKILLVCVVFAILLSISNTTAQYVADIETNQVHLKVIEKDTTAPLLTINNTSGLSANEPSCSIEPTYTISGKAIDEKSGLKNVMINGVPINVDSDGFWQTTLVLTEQTTTITVTASDNNGNIATENRYVKYSNPNTDYCILVDTAGEFLYDTIFGESQHHRIYTKVNEGAAIFTIYAWESPEDGNTYVGPLLISKIADAVTYSTPDSDGQTFPYSATFDYNGDTWYISSYLWHIEDFYINTISSTLLLNSKTGVERYQWPMIDAAQDLLDLLFDQ